MLRTPAPFPHVGSYAMLEEDGETHLVRIVGKDPDGNATISFPNRLKIASGNKTVPVDQLIDGTPLTADERAEYEELERTTPAEPSRSDRVRAQQDRYQALRLRDIHSATLATLMAARKVPAPAEGVAA